MLKSKKKIILIAIVAILLILSNVCFGATASSKNATFEIVENNVCNIKINEFATFEKKIVSYDLEKKEVDLQLKVTNTATPIINEPTEIMFVIDNSLSMVENQVSSGVTRMDAVASAAKELASGLLENNLIKIGIVNFSTGAIANQGTVENDAELRLTPSNVKADVLAAITSIETDTKAAKAANLDKYVRTDIEAGLTLAGRQFSNTCNSKYIVLLSDGNPNVSLAGSQTRFSGETATRTKAKLLELHNSGITFFTVMTGVRASTLEATSGLTYGELVEEVFGTVSNPTVDYFYFITDSQIQETIAEEILSNFQDTNITTLTNLKIYDYFPQQIIDNFEFSYVQDPTKGNISAEVDKTNRMITWTIAKLEAGETANVIYKLKLKDTFDSAIINKVLNTNEKVVITADENPEPVDSYVTPKVKVTLPGTVTIKYIDKDTKKDLAPNDILNGKVDDTYKTTRKNIEGYTAAEPEPTNKEGKFTTEPITVIYYYVKTPDTTVAKKEIPQTGTTLVLPIMLVTASAFTVILGIKAYKHEK